MVTLSMEDLCAQDPKYIFIDETWPMLVDWHAECPTKQYNLKLEVRPNE